MNKVVVVTLSGGLIGILIDSPARALRRTIAEHNAAGWKVAQVIPSETGNVLMFIGRLLLLVCTLFLFTSTNGYYIIFERIGTATGADIVPGAATPHCSRCGGVVEAVDAFCEHCGNKLG
ncbi:MAG: hypothetical protein IPH05_06275 [Flavobacteriales bacterium]|jgi:hypothetical protein|nr:hypothetical protein [Flavobacteriales bacterium]MBK6882540.1 hypothetical protein [Flavobacteriales bacterium]MBK7101242.1 hypothetical protein [Flavobacteriales bacterium]MBK7111951.1 hypothetical protein [Flavobacteriales bacterium]MBK7619021.1 hypothetical protein [Flavobacteriales bacterium]